MSKQIAVDLSTELAEGFVLPPAGIPTVSYTHLTLPTILLV